MAILSKIRRWYFRDKLSLREIARRTGFSRNTVRRYLRNEISEPVYPKRQTPSKLEAFSDKLRQWLVDAARTSCKQRRSLKQMHVDLHLNLTHLCIQKMTLKKRAETQTSYSY